MNLNVQTTFIKANEQYFEALKQLDKIVETAEFIEYVHNDKQIYIRHDKRIQDGDGCAVFIEPQLNMTRTLRFDAPAFKLQLSICRHKMTYKQSSNVAVEILASPMYSTDFIDGLGVCQQWKDKLKAFVVGCEFPHPAE